MSKEPFRQPPMNPDFVRTEEGFLTQQNRTVKDSSSSYLANKSSLKIRYGNEKLPSLRPGQLQLNSVFSTF